MDLKVGNLITEKFIIKRFVLGDERLKQCKKVFGKDYFDKSA